MTRKRDTLKLGITVIVMFGLFFAGLLFVGGEGMFRGEGKRLVVRFAPGGTMPEISRGSFVTYFGQKVGVVTTAKIVVDVDPQDPTIKDRPFLEIRASLHEDLDLRKDCRIVASGPPLGGFGMLEIINRGTATEVIEEDEPIYGQPAGFQAALDMITRELDESNEDGLIAMIKLQLDSQDENSVMAKIHRSLEDINSTTASLALELDPKQQDVLIYKFHVAVDQINASLAELTTLVQTNRPKLDRTIASVESASAKLDTDIIGPLALEFELEGDREGTLLAKAHDAFDRVKQSLGDINVATDGAKDVIVLNKDRVSELIENAGSASMHLKQGVKDISLHPWKLFFPPSDAERRELHIYNVAREFAEAAAHLDDSTSRLKSLLDSYDGEVPSDDVELARIRDDLHITIKKFNEAERALWDELKLQ